GEVGEVHHRLVVVDVALVAGRVDLDESDRGRELAAVFVVDEEGATAGHVGSLVEAAVARTDRANGVGARNAAEQDRGRRDAIDQANGKAGGTGQRRGIRRVDGGRVDVAELELAGTREMNDPGGMSRINRRQL